MASTSSTHKNELRSEQRTDWVSVDHNLARVAKQLKRQNSLGWSFARGVMAGLGASLGVTLVLTVVVFALSQIAGWLGIETIVQPLVESIQ
jgi:hypothetical protein